MEQIETIAALATPYGRGGIGIIRISGPVTTEIAKTILKILPCPRQAEYLSFYDKDGILLDKGIAIFFPKPFSFTGEDVLELHGHGGPIILDLLLQSILLLPNIRIAKPGEFSERAFLNNKIDLTQAEAITDLINASSVQAARAAINSLQGMFSQHIDKIVKNINTLRINIEASIEFPDQHIKILSKDEIYNSLNMIISSLNILNNKGQQSNLLCKGVKIVITGKPNVGKSSLLNILVNQTVAIVTPIAGTTRDILYKNIYIDGIPLEIVDTAGLHDTDNEIELIGISRAWNEIKKSDHILFVIDNLPSNQNIKELLFSVFQSNIPIGMPITIVYNKSDLTNRKIGVDHIDGYNIINISAKFNLGIDILRTFLRKSIGYINTNESIFLARDRHLSALKTASIYLNQAKEQLTYTHTIDFLAENLRMAQKSLNEITGKVTSKHIIDQIFSNFCIGK